MKIENTYVFCDVDGTLGIEGLGIPERNREAIQRFVDMGGHFAVCTGRWVEAVRAFCDGLPINAPCVIGNGAGIYDYEKDDVRYFQSMPSDVTDIYEDLLEYEPEFGLLGVSLEKGYHYLGDPEKNAKVFGRSLQYPSMPRPEADTYIKFHIGLPQEENAVAALKRLNTRYVTHLDQVRFVQTDEQYIEMLPVHANKGAGIRKIMAMEAMDISHSVFIGNHFNDFEAFQVAGLSACVASTPDALRFIPTFRLGDAMEGAVADMLNMLMRKARQKELLLRTAI